MWKKKWVPILSSVVLAGATFLPVTTDAAVGKKNVQASYNNIKVMYNGVNVPTTIEPFIVNGSTYIPVRMMANVFNKDVVWNGTTYTIDVKDRPDTRVTALQAEVATKDAKIKDLEAKIADLEDEIDDLKDRKSSKDDDVDDRIDDLETDLNDDYGDYEDLEWDISLSGDEDDISVEIAIDFDDYEDEFNDLTKSQLKKLVKEICNDIWDKFEDANIDGEIIDSVEDDLQYEFSGDGDDHDIEFDGSTI
ncbi:stalk domain-containing protein [Brevibacillus borstelensis]|jgi:Copper amine oxidase N-terminal domain|uniref:stalk domain-containing protein n=1 Tax=Brevibacillus borstelensis TaxID=45462 RepID=UPI00203EC5CB|nr:stalk domain-containing protein [Brevibacillus borstelensis]MCM3593670.1 stalk domain-containing protein [Brevibacillus borstelensis]MCM3625428.1 stalk domain-containing protein [Brevibacillus borstelensis]